jgi:hypothetical protein
VLSLFKIPRNKSVPASYLLSLQFKEVIDFELQQASMGQRAPI